MTRRDLIRVSHARKFLVFIAMSLSLLSGGSAMACSCMFYESAEAHVSATAVIFEGVALETVRAGDDWDSQRTRFQVTRALKGTAENTVEIYHAEDVCCICGVSFEKGGEYLIFAYRNSDGDLGTSSCSKAHHPREDYEAVFRALEMNEGD